MSTFTQEQEAILNGGDTSGKTGGTFDRLLKQESGGRQFNTNGGVVTSSKGATGIAQVMPATGPEAAKLAGVEWNPERFKSDPEYNKSLGRAYFDKQLATFGNERLALAAYNAGPGAVQKAIQRAEKSGGDPLAYLPEETQKYVPAILGAGFGVKRAASSPWSQQPKYVDPGFNKAIEHEALQDAADESPVSTSLERGWEGLKHNAGLFLDNVTDDSQGAAERIKAKREWDDANPAPRSSTKFVEQFQQLAEDDYAGMLATAVKNPGGALNQMVEQTPNSLPALALQIPVGIASSALLATGWGAPLAVGLQGLAAFVGNALPEGGAYIEEQLGKAGINPNDTSAVAKWIAENRSKNLEGGVKKAGVISLVDGATGYLGGKLIAGPSIRFAQAEAAVFAKAGVKTTDKAAVAAARATPAYKQAMAQPAQELLAATTRAQKTVRELGGLGLETAGEGIGEYAGSYAADGTASVKDAVLESMMGAGTSAAMTGANMTLGAMKGPDGSRADLDALAATPQPAQPTITPNSPLTNAASIAQAAHTNLAAQQQALVDQEAATAAPDIDPAIVQQRQQEAVRRQAMASQRAAAGLAPDYSGAEDAESEIAGATGAQEQDRILEMNRMMAEEQADLAERRGDMMEAQRIRQSEQQHRESIQASRARNSVGAPSGSFGQMNEFADFLGQEQQDIADRRQVAADRQAEAQRNEALRAQSELEAADARVSAQMARESESRRRAVLDAILADPDTANPAARLAAELKRQGFRDTTPTQAELDTIQRFSDIQNAEAEPDIIPSSPNELDPYQVRQERPRQPAKPRLTVEQIKQAIANGATLSKDALALPDGSRVKLKGPQIAAARQAILKKAQDGASNERPNAEVAPQAPESGSPVVQGSANAVDARAGAGAEPQDIMPAGVDSRVGQNAPDGNGGVAEPSTETFDVSTRTDDQLRYLAEKGKDGWREAAQAELAKRTPADVSLTNEGKTTQPVEPEAKNVDPLDKEISDAAAHLADVLADVFGAKLNITGPQHSAADLLPAMQKVIGLLVQKGFKTFAQAVGQTARMLRDNGAGEHVEKITPRQWKAAYQFAADMPGVEGAESEEAVAALSADKVLAIVSGQVDKAKAEAEARTDTNPSDAQKEAENYRKGKFSWNGQTISVENPKGSERTGKGEDGTEWRTVMPATYGYFLGTVGADKDHVDVFMGDTLDAPSFWVINQTQPDSAKFDEHKVVAGVTSADEAKRIYLDSFSDGFGDKVFSSIAGPYPVGELADVLPKLKAKKPFGVKKESPRDAHIRAKEEAYTARREGQPVPPKALEIVRTEAGKEFDKAEAIHKDPGQPAEAVTPAVVAESIRKSAANTPLDVKEAKAYLLAEIDKAILAAGDKSELEAELAREKAKEFDGKDMEKRGIGRKQIIAARDAFNALRDSNIAKTVEQIGFVTFDVPGDGKFKVANSAAKLQEFRRKVETSPGFKNPATKPPTMRSETNTGSYGPRDAILDGDYLNAYELAKLQDKPLVFSVGTNNQKPTAYTDTSTADGIIDGISFVVGREATKDGKWFVIEPATGILLNKNGLPSKVAALTASKALTKGKEDALRKVIADPAKAMPQSTLEAEWLAWAEKEEGVTLDRQAEAATNEREREEARKVDEERKAESEATKKVHGKPHGWMRDGVGLGGVQKQTRIVARPDGSLIQGVMYETAGRFDHGHVELLGAAGSAEKTLLSVGRQSNPDEAQAKIDAYLDRIQGPVETNERPVKQENDAESDAAALAGVPETVQRYVRRALDGLNEVHRRLQSVERARGRGHILATEWRDAQPEVKSRNEVLAKFRDISKGNGTDAEAVIRALGGEPDFSGYSMPDGDHAISGQESPQKDAQPDNTQPSDLPGIFTGLASRGLAKTRAQKAAEAHPRAAQIAYVQDNFMDILTELENSGLVKINCD